MRWTITLLLVAACSFQAPRAGLGDAGAGDGAIDTDAASSDAEVDPDASGAPWWDPAWSTRMRIVIDNAAPLAQGFQIGLPRDLDLAPCAGPRDAVRVVRDHTTEIPRVIDELGGDEWIWFRLTEALPAAAGPSAYWLYCGNPGAPPAPSDPSTVFDLYDDFDGSSLSSAWISQGSVTVGGGAVTLNGNNAGIHTTATYGSGTATDFILQASGAALADPWFWGGFEIGFTTTPPWVIWHCEDPNVIKQEIRSVANEVSMNARALDTAPHLYGVEHHGSSARFRHGNASAGSIPYGPPIVSPMNVRLHNFASNGTIQIHMARVRRAVDPIPAVTLGAVELRP